MSYCEECPAGSSAPLSGSTDCTICSPGSYTPTSGLAECLACAAGTVQFEFGGKTCEICPEGYASLPAPIADTFGAYVCGSLSFAKVINWGPVANPFLLAANVTVEGANGPIPDWLSVRVSGSKVITFTSVMIPPQPGMLNLSVKITHTCRAVPWVGSISLELFRDDPALSFGSTEITAGKVEACPAFFTQYAVRLGTCEAQTKVIALLSNGSALPDNVTYSYANGLLAIAGTMPRGEKSLTIIGEAQLGNEVFRSPPTNVTLAPGNAVTIRTSETKLRACPYISIEFTASRASSCGYLDVKALLANGSSLPSFLSVATTANQLSHTSSLIIFGTVPDGYPVFNITAFAQVAGGPIFSSAPVLVTRPLTASDANVSLSVDTASTVSTFTASSTLSPLVLGAPYGAVRHISMSITSPTQSCSSLSLVIATSLDPSEPGAAGSPSLELPLGITVTRISTTSALISASPTNTVAPKTKATLYIWANDGLRNPGFNLTIVTEQSLRIADTAETRIPKVDTPSSLLQMQLVLTGAPMTNPPIFICPTDAAAAFCSVGADSSSLGIFGTPAGVNAVLNGLSFTFLSSAQAPLVANSSNITLALTFKESVNPSPLQVEIPLSALQTYTGVSQTKTLSLTGTAGKPFAEPITNFFTTNDATTVTYTLNSSESWLTIQGGFIGGTPPSPPRVIYFTVDVSDSHTHLPAKGLVNVSWPAQPRVNTPALSHWFVVSSTQLDVQLPLDLIVDPENGTIAFDIQQLTGSELQPIPPFLTFQASNLRLTGTPQAGDVGTYSLLLTGTSQWGSWKGNAAVVLTITVSQSWADFFAWVYSIVGYCASAAGLVTWCLVYRSLLTNIVVFNRRMKSLPKSLHISGRYTIEKLVSVDIDLSLPIPAEHVKVVRVIWLKEPASGMPARWYQSEYLEMQKRLAKTRARPGELVNAPSWARAENIRDVKVELILDIPMMKELLSTGFLLPEDEYYVEVISTGTWSSGTIIEAFTFRVSEVVYGELAPAEDVVEDPFVDEVDLLAQLEALDSVNIERESKSSAEPHEGKPHRQARLVDPYTGQALMSAQPVSDDGSDDDHDILYSKSDSEESSMKSDSSCESEPPPPPPHYEL